MLKVILIIVIFTLSVTIGYIYGDSFRKRVTHLKEINKSLILLQNEVVYMNAALPIAIEDIAIKANEPLADFLLKVSESLKEGSEGDVYSSFKKVYRDYEDEFYLEKEDKSILEDFVKSLGESGVYGQDKIFNLVLENLKLNIEEASENSKKNVKLYRSLGLCVGAMISIFIL